MLGAHFSGSGATGMGIALFDLDNTLIAGDSDFLWGEFLSEQGIVDAACYARENQRFYDQYRTGVLDIRAFLRFSLQVLAAHAPARLREWRRQYIDEKIRPILLPKARALIDRHRAHGDIPVIITATNRFVTEPIAALYGIEHLLATEPEQIEGHYTGEVTGTPCFQQGKVVVLEAWLEQHALSLENSAFYSDSHNDLPLLQRVTHPTAVDPDEILASHAQQHHWPVISLR
jgi:HAD superfamily hydrolase (TIGR01490 family)